MIKKELLSSGVVLLFNLINSSLWNRKRNNIFGVVTEETLGALRKNLKRQTLENQGCYITARVFIKSSSRSKNILAKNIASNLLLPFKTTELK